MGRKEIIEINLVKGMTYESLISNIIETLVVELELDKRKKKALSYIDIDVIVVLDSKMVTRFEDKTVGKSFITSSFITSIAEAEIEIHGSYNHKKDLRMIETELTEIVVNQIDLNGYDIAKGGVMFVMYRQIN